MNNTNSNLKFIKEKIKNIHFGIFKPDAENDLQMLNNVVQVLNIDDEGNVWFETSCKNFSQYDIGRKMFANLEFNSRGFKSRLVISGCAEIIEELNKTSSNHSISIRFRITNAESINYRLAKEGNMFSKIKEAFQQIFINNNPKQLQFQ